MKAHISHTFCTSPVNPDRVITMQVRSNPISSFRMNTNLCRGPRLVSLNQPRVLRKGQFITVGSSQKRNNRVWHGCAALHNWPNSLHPGFNKVPSIIEAKSPTKACLVLVLFKWTREWRTRKHLFSTTSVSLYTKVKRDAKKAGAMWRLCPE